jgi:hypothetical protein
MHRGEYWGFVFLTGEKIPFPVDDLHAVKKNKSYAVSNDEVYCLLIPLLKEYTDFLS